MGRYDRQLSNSLFACDGDEKKATTFFLAWLMQNFPTQYRKTKALLDAPGAEIKFPEANQIAIKGGADLPDHEIRIVRKNGKLYKLIDRPIQRYGRGVTVTVNRAD